jgi:uncharacterized membrane protein YdcZ (DUF606 family)
MVLTDHQQSLLQRKMRVRTLPEESTYEGRAQRAVDSANHAIRGLFLINGGAAVATLGFIASIIPNAEESKIAAIALNRALNSLVFFGVGTLCAAFLAVIAYWVNRLDFELLARSWEKLTRWYWIAYTLAVIFLLGSFASFALGLLQIVGLGKP